MLHDEWAEPGASMVVINARVASENDDLTGLNTVGRGTLFIDELSALSLKAQAILLDVIENRTFIDQRKRVSESHI